MKSRLPIAVLLVAALGFSYGLFQLFKLRFDIGDVYPPYSSLRADPLGTKALFESLDRLPGLAPRRHYQPFTKITDLRDTTYLYLAEPSADHDPTERDAAEQLERLISDRGRVVFTFKPDLSDPKLSRDTDAPDDTEPADADAKKPAPGTKPPPKSKDAAKPAKKKRPTDDEEPSRKFELISLNERWGLDLAFTALPGDQDGRPQPVTVTRRSIPLAPRRGEGRGEGPNRTNAATHNLQPLDSLPASISWHSGFHFTNLAPAWRVIYERDGRPVLIERPFGQGTIVMATDSYFVSNESLRKERHAPLLSWLIGPSRTILFDETHLGVTENPGIATLARKYHLHGLFAVILLLAGLYIWKSATSFIPPVDADDAPGDHVTGRDASAGFVNLLRRNIPTADLLNVCLTEWRKTIKPGPSGLTPAKLQQIESILRDQQALPARDRHPVHTYQVICHVLKKRDGVKRET